MSRQETEDDRRARKAREREKTDRRTETEEERRVRKERERGEGRRDETEEERRARKERERADGRREETEEERRIRKEREQGEVRREETEEERRVRKERERAEGRRDETEEERRARKERERAEGRREETEEERRARKERERREETEDERRQRKERERRREDEERKVRKEREEEEQRAKLKAVKSEVEDPYADEVFEEEVFSPADVVAAQQAVNAENAALTRARQAPLVAHEPQVVGVSRAGLDVTSLERQKQRQAFESQISRATALRRLIDLDESRFILADLPPLTEYDLYVRNVGGAARGQVGSQCPAVEERSDLAIQAERVARKTRGCQAPDDLGLFPERSVHNRLESQSDDTSDWLSTLDGPA